MLIKSNKIMTIKNLLNDIALLNIKKQSLTKVLSTNSPRTQIHAGQISAVMYRYC